MCGLFFFLVVVRGVGGVGDGTAARFTREFIFCFFMYLPTYVVRFAI